MIVDVYINTHLSSFIFVTNNSESYFILNAATCEFLCTKIVKIKPEIDSFKPKW